jgi:acyl carrier protein
MVPTAFVQLERLPRNTSGKVDRAALPMPPEQSAGADGYAAPQGELEERLAGLWAELLQVDRVGLDDNFFDLGGHSMLALQMRAAMQSRFGFELSIVDLFSHASIRSLMSHLGQHRSRPQEQISGSVRARRAREHFEQQSRNRRH